MSVRFKELAGSPVEDYGPEGMTAERRILCAWEDRLAMATELLGAGYSLGATGTAVYPGRPSMVAVRVKVEPFEARPDPQGAFSQIASQLNAYHGQLARLTIDYEPAAAAASVEGLPEVAVGTTVDYRLSTAVAEVVSAQTGAEVAVPVIAHHVIWQPVLRPPWGAIRASVGTVNGETFLGASAGRLLLASVATRRIFTGVEEQQPQFAWRMHYVFHEWGAQTGLGWEAVVGASGPIPPGGEPAGRNADFSALLQLGR
jgi:hypothetical protein